MVFKSYTKQDTHILKGFAILCIVLHNYFHWLSPSPGENEFDFSALRVATFFDQMAQEPGEFINILLSYFGHYGVQIFVFLSGFGLALSMMNHQKTWEAFVMHRLKKLYPLLLTGVIVLFFSTILMSESWLSGYEWKEIGYKLLFIHTLMPDSGLSMNGPWWFFGLVFQLYLLFPLLFKWMKKSRWKAFALICLLCYGVLFLFKEFLSASIASMFMQNAIGHLPEFCFGIMLAFHREKKISIVWLLVAVAVFVAGNFFSAFYLFTFLSLTVIVVFAYQKVKSIPIRKGSLRRFLVYWGEISMVLFAVHGFFRSPVINVAKDMGGAWGHLLSGVIFLLIAWAVSIVAKKIYDFLCLQLDRIHIRESRWTHRIGRAFQIVLGLFFVGILGYFIVQSSGKLEKELPDIVQYAESAVIDPQSEYLLLTEAPFDKRYAALRVKGSFDMCSLDTLSLLPHLVLDIPDVLWTAIDIPSEYNTSVSKCFDFTYDYMVPFAVNTKGKMMKVYFWNSNNGALRIENAQVKMFH